MSVVINGKYKLINAGTKNLISISSEGKLVVSTSEEPAQLIIKSAEDSAGLFKILVGVGGAEKRLSVCDSSDIPSLALMNKNTNVKQQFGLRKVDKGDTTPTYLISNGSYCVADDGAKLILTGPVGAEGKQQQHWKLVPC